jgi:hypothetical protein
MTGEDAVRFNAVWERVLERTLGEAHVTNYILEIMGFRPKRLITPEEWVFQIDRP